MVFTFLCVSFGLAFLLVSGYFSVKLVKLIYDLRKARFKDEKSEFLADLHHIQMKWMQRGEYQFAKGVAMIIEAFTKDEDNTEPITQHGKDLLKQLEAAAFSKATEREEEI